MASFSASSSASTPPRENERIPSWIERLLAMTFFAVCQFHADRPRNLCKKYCVDCDDNIARCAYCISSAHKNHRVIQVRRSSYNDVVNVADIHKATNLSGIQTYVINSVKVIFLTTRGAPRNQHSNKNTGRLKVKNSTSKCVMCFRNLMDPFHFCSLECKLEWVKYGNDESDEIKGIPRSMLSKKEEEEYQKRKKAEEELRKRRAALLPPPPPPPPGPSARNTRSTCLNSLKRKGTPHRAPFF